VPAVVWPRCRTAAASSRFRRVRCSLTAVLPRADRQYLREPFEIIDPAQYKDPWPLNDIEVMQNVFVRILPSRNARYERPDCRLKSHEECWWEEFPEAVWQCGMLEGMYWRELQHVLQYWSPENVKIVFTEDFSADMIGVTKEVAQFFGLPRFNGYEIPPHGTGMNEGNNEGTQV
jgi:hypothetical protein